MGYGRLWPSDSYYEGLRMTGIKLLLMTCRRDSVIVIVIINQFISFQSVTMPKKIFFFETFILALCNRLEDRAIH